MTLKFRSLGKAAGVEIYGATAGVYSFLIGKTDEGAYNLSYKKTNELRPKTIFLIHYESPVSSLAEAVAKAEEFLRTTQLN